MLALLPALIASAACDSGHATQTAAAPPPGYAFPALTGRVVDRADLLPASDEAALTARLAKLDHETGHQFVIATVKSLGGHGIEDYSLKLANYWGVGRKHINDGLVLLVAPTEKKARIEVGDGLERAVPDDEAARIIQADILPDFRKGRMAAGIDQGADDIIADLSKEAT